MKRRSILLAEDDTNIQLGIVDALESEGYSVTTAGNGEEALVWLRQMKFDLVLLDVMMPLKSGYDVCREIRKSDLVTPIIMLTAKGEEIDKVVGLELGADDYVTKPFGLRELLARISGVLRRSALIENVASSDHSFDFGEAKIDPKRFEAQLDGRVMTLTPREVKLLSFFNLHAGESLSRDALLNAAWGIDYLGTTRTLDQHISQLRKKIERDAARPRVLITVHGFGYRYEPID